MEDGRRLRRLSGAGDDHIRAVTAPLTLDEIATERARRNLHTFVRQAWDVVEPSTPFVDNWHIGAICEHLQAVSSGEIRKLLMNVPPGCMKSLLTCVFWRGWEWIDNPALRRLSWSFDEALTIRDSSRTHDLVTSEWYQERWPHVQFKPDANEKRRRETTAGGWIIASSFGGRGTGEHPDRIEVDDPHNPKQAESDAERQSALDRFDQTLTTRGASRGARHVVIMQRLNERDLSGHILNRADADEWTWLCLPMRYERIPMVTVAKRSEADPRGPGVLLWPGLFSEQTVKSLETALGSYAAAGQLQQRPAPAGGGLFKREWFEYVDAAPVKARKVRAWDKAGTDAGGDWSAGILLYESDGIYYVVDAQRDRLSSGQRNALIRSVAATDGPDVHIRIEQEPGSGGKESAEISVRQLAGYVVKVKPSTVDKVSRARPFAVQCEAKNVRLVRGAWNAKFIDELCVFPNGAHDDQVDAAASAFNELALGQREVIAAVTPGDTSWQRGHFR